MNRYLLDTSIVLYALKYPERLGDNTRQILTGSHTIYVSSVSIWEIVIKIRAGKLRIPRPLQEITALLGAAELSVAHCHTFTALTIELPHKDPFDHMLIAQSVTEKLPLITTDRVLLASSYETIDGQK